MSQEKLSELMQSAVRHHGKGELAEAKAIYEQVLEKWPENSEAMNLLGAVRFQMGEREAGLQLLRKSIEREPGNAARYVNLGLTLLLDGKAEEAAEVYGKAVQLNPGDFESHFGLANALFDRRRMEEAIGEYRAALAIRPGAAGALYKMGVGLRAVGRFDECVTVLKQVLAANPAHYDTLVELAVAMEFLGRIAESIDLAKRATIANPQGAEGHNTLGTSLLMSHNLDAATASIRRAVEISPETAAYHSNLSMALKDAGDVEGAIASSAAALSLDPKDATIHSGRIFLLHLHPDYDAMRLFEEARLWNARHAVPLMGEQRPFDNDRSPDRRLRIGFVSSDLHMHPLGRCFMPLLPHHDRDQFEYFCYSGSLKRDEVTAALKQWTDVWRETGGLHDPQVCEMIRRDRIDVLVDLSMHSSKHRLLAFARRPAPVQMTFLAYCSTTGMDAMDYRVTDPYLDPDRDPPCYSERSLFLPKCYWCYAPMNSDAVTKTPTETNRYVTFGTLNNFCKNSSRAIGTWMRILRAVPGSRLILHAAAGSHRDRLRERFAAAGIDPARLEFAGHAKFPDYIRKYEGIDIALDPFPYAGGTTTLDALWMGVPTVTLNGRTGVGRGGVSIMRNVGLGELVASSEEEYVRIAAELAGDLGRVASLRGSMRERMRQSPLMDAVQYSRGFESLLREAWRNWCNR